MLDSYLQFCWLDLLGSRQHVIVFSCCRSQCCSAVLQHGQEQREEQMALQSYMLNRLASSFESLADKTVQLPTAAHRSGPGQQRPRLLQAFRCSWLPSAWLQPHAPPPLQSAPMSRHARHTIFSCTLRYTHPFVESTARCTVWVTRFALTSASRAAMAASMSIVSSSC
jgi:hypothetical protein